MGDRENPSASSTSIDGFVIPLDPMDELGCDSCQ